jgi:hypothetical protein
MVGCSGLRWTSGYTNKLCIGVTTPDVVDHGLKSAFVTEVARIKMTKEGETHLTCLARFHSTVLSSIRNVSTADNSDIEIRAKWGRRSLYLSSSYRRLKVTRFPLGKLPRLVHASHRPYCLPVDKGASPKWPELTRPGV